MECYEQKYCQYCKYCQTIINYGPYGYSESEIECINKPANKDYKQACAKAARNFYNDNYYRYLVELGEEKLKKNGRSPVTITIGLEHKFEKEVWKVDGLEKLFEYYKTDEKGIKHYYIDRKADEDFFCFNPDMPEYQTISAKEIKKMKQLLRS